MGRYQKKLNENKRPEFVGNYVKEGKKDWSCWYYEKRNIFGPQQPLSDDQNELNVKITQNGTESDLLSSCDHHKDQSESIRTFGQWPAGQNIHTPGPCEI